MRSATVVRPNSGWQHLRLGAPANAHARRDGARQPGEDWYFFGFPACLLHIFVHDVAVTHIWAHRRSIHSRDSAQSPRAMKVRPPCSEQLPPLSAHVTPSPSRPRSWTRSTRRLPRARCVVARLRGDRPPAEPELHRLSSLSSSFRQRRTTAWRTYGSVWTAWSHCRCAACELSLAGVEKRQLWLAQRRGCCCTAPHAVPPPAPRRCVQFIRLVLGCEAAEQRSWVHAVARPFQLAAHCPPLHRPRSPCSATSPGAQAAPPQT